MKSLIVRSLEAVVSLFKHKKTRKSGSDQKYLFLPLFGMIGDGVLFLDALSGYLSFFHDEQGYRVVIGCRHQMADLIKMVYPDKVYEIVEMNRNRMQRSLKEFLSCLTRLEKYNFDLILNVRERLSDENILIYAIPAKQKITFRNNDAEPENIVKRFFYRNTYDSVVYADPDADQYKRYGKFLRELGYKDYVSHISRIPMQQELGTQRKKSNEPYIIISPGASDEKKCWPTDRFAILCDRIITDFDMDVYITGAGADRKYADIIRQSVKNRERVYDYCGNTSIPEWIELIRGAKLVISNDSASVHVAAAVQTPSVCIAPQHDGYRFLPFQPDEVRPDDVLPYPVRCDRVNCFDCRLNNRKDEIYGDIDCQDSIKKLGAFKCISGIAVEMVYTEIGKLLKGSAENEDQISE